MSTNAVAAQSQHFFPTAAFCDKNYKAIRLDVDNLSKKCVEIFYRVISAICSLFSDRLAHRYDCLAQFENFKRHSVITYQRYGDKIIDFSTNGFTHVVEKLPAGTSESESIKNIYGADKVDRLCRMFPVELLGYLSRQEMVNDGCSWGMSIDFISSYFRQRQTGKSALEAVKEIAPHFVNGASDDAEICQIFQSAFARMAIAKPIAEGEEKLRQWLAAEEANLKAQVENMTGAQVLNKVELLLGLEARQKGDEIGHQVFDEFINNEAVEGCTKIVSTVHLAASHPLINKRDIDKEDLENLVNDLPMGAYEVGISGRNNDGPGFAHSIVYIKTDEGKDFIFEPNEATLVAESGESFALLWNRVNAQHASEELRLVFTPYHVA